MEKQHNIILGLVFFVGLYLSTIYNPIVSIILLVATEMVVMYREKMHLKHVKLKAKRNRFM